MIQDISTKQFYNIKPKHDGENNLPCPVCSHTRKKQTEPCMQFNQTTGVGQCYHCGAKFIADWKISQSKPKEYKIPKWKNATRLSNKAVQFFTGRGISQDTLNALNIYSDSEFMPQYGKEVDVICFPYFVNLELKNVKYRAGGKKFKLFSGAELVWYNFDCIAQSKELIIVEGEIDALSFYEIGYKNVVSVPNGASNREMPYLDNYVDQLEHIETFYIAVDIDEPGLKLRSELIRRLGCEKCKIITFGEFKDANELLLAKGGLELKECIKNAIDVPLEGVVDLANHRDELWNLYLNGLPEANTIGIDVMDNLVKWKTGLLAIWTGIPSHGKSEMLDFVSARLNLLYGWKVAFFSPENMPYYRYHFPKIASKIIGSGFTHKYMSVNDFNASVEYINDNFKYIDAEDDFTVDTILEIAKALVKRVGIKVLNIDPYNCFEHRTNKNESETQYIGRFLDTLVRFAKKYDVLVNLVAHPRKMERSGNTTSFAIPTLYDISGSSNFFNKADIGISIHRNFIDNSTMFRVQKVRFKDLGETGDATLYYDTINGRYNDTPNSKDRSNYLLHSAQEPIVINISQSDYDCPF